MSNMEAFNKIMSEIGEQLNEETITAIKAALEAKVEPVAWMSTHDVGFKKSEFGNTPTIPLYTTPPQRMWEGLTEEDKQDWIKCMPWPPEPAHLMVLIEGIELELRELNK